MFFCFPLLHIIFFIFFNNRYYPLNLILNFNVAFLLSCLSVFVPLWYYLFENKTSDKKKNKKKNKKNPKLSKVSVLNVLSHLSPLFIWALVMQTRPHKEERFLYFVYPLICFSAALSLHCICQSITYLFGCSNNNNINT